MQVGQYNQRITFKEAPVVQSQSTDRWGVVIPDGSSANTFKKWASVLNVSKKFIDGKAPLTKDVLEIRCHYTKDIHSAMQLVVDNLTYDIETVVDYNMSRKELLVVASRTVKGGQ